MSSKKAHPEKVNPSLARMTMGQTDERGKVWTHYILVHYRTTGDLAPGCDARDLYAWLEQNMPIQLAAITRKGK